MPRSVIVILKSLLVIAPLSSCLYVECLSDLYLREYVGNFLPVDGWRLGVLAVMVAMGSLKSMIFSRNR